MARVTGCDFYPIKRFRDQPDSRHWLLRFVQKLYLPFGVLFQVERNATFDFAANAGQLFPRNIAVAKFRAVIAGSGVVAILDAEII